MLLVRDLEMITRSYACVNTACMSVASVWFAPVGLSINSNAMFICKGGGGLESGQMDELLVSPRLQSAAGGQVVTHVTEAFDLEPRPQREGTYRNQPAKFT